MSSHSWWTASAAAAPDTSAPVLSPVLRRPFGWDGSEGGDPRQRAADDQLLDLAGAFVERHHPGVAQQLADRVLVDVAVAAEDLEGVVGCADGGLGGEELR